MDHLCWATFVDSGTVLHKLYRASYHAVWPAVVGDGPEVVVVACVKHCLSSYPAVTVVQHDGHAGRSVEAQFICYEGCSLHVSRDFEKTRRWSMFPMVQRTAISAQVQRS